ncbi:RNA polymerase sigma factor [uncultured Tateyamaria sp.]|uniref:RNA polymerase sigma factor n=1 Tax=uncultured Tateyamaria sp. TaxID=455651 RepID=UPI00345D3CFC
MSIRTSSQNSVSIVRDGIPAVYPRLWRYAVALTGRRDWADDLVQTTCLRALDKADQFEPGTHLDRWMFRMAQRVWLNELRSRKVRTGGGLVPVEEIDLPDKKPEPETNILARDVLNRVNALPEAQRQAVVLVYVEGYAYKEAAEIMEIPIGTVMSRLAAARKRLNSEMAEDKAKVQ